MKVQSPLKIMIDSTKVIDYNTQPYNSNIKQYKGI
jgi:hypothetical protein